MTKHKLHVAVACGGTGGHIYPGLATARALRDQGHHVTLWLAGKGVEDTVLQGWKGPVVTIPAEGFQFGVLRSIWTACSISLAIIRCWTVMLRHRPDVVLAMGSYSSIGPCLAAHLRRIPFVLHEANAVPGRAVRLLASRAKSIGICFEETRYHLKGLELVSTGMPLRPELKKEEGRSSESPFHLLVMGGSGGAHDVNEIASQAICSLEDLSLCVTHLTGPADESHIRRRYEAAGVEADVQAYVQEMAKVYNNVDFAVCRAGASSCAELGVFGIPSLLVPYPHAASDHQTANAHALEKIGAADLVQQDDMTVEWLAGYIRTQIEDPARVEKMRERAYRPDSLTAAQKLAEMIEACVQK